MNKTLRYIVGIVLGAFGLLTIFLSSSVILDLFGIREQEGNYVLFIVWTNFIASLLYLISTYGFFSKKKFTTKLLGFSTVLLFIAFIGLNYHINSGGIYELKTFKAMIFRTSITAIFTAISYYTITRNKIEKI